MHGEAGVSRLVYNSAMKRLLVVISILAVLFGLALFSAAILFGGAFGSSGTHFTSADVFQAINKYRADHGLGGLEKLDSLCTLAEMRLKDLETGEYSHMGFESRQSTSTSGSLFDYCEGCVAIGENLAGSVGNPDGIDDVMYKWSISPTHNKNMLGDYNKQCVVRRGRYIVSLFALQ